jgi:hypothetical protein
MRNKPDGAWSRSESVTLVRPRALVSELVVMVGAEMVKINFWEWLPRAVSRVGGRDALPHEEPLRRCVAGA